MMSNLLKNIKNIKLQWQVSGKRYYSPNSKHCHGNDPWGRLLGCQICFDSRSARRRYRLFMGYFCRELAAERLHCLHCMLIRRMNMYNSVVMDVSDIWMAVVMSTTVRTMEAVGE